MTLLLLLACAEDQLQSAMFDGPIAAAVLPAAVNAWDEPVGFVANQRSGTVVPLDLKEGRFLTDDATASFLAASELALGRERLLGDLVVVGDDTRVTLWSVDTARGQLLSVPYVTGLGADGSPTEAVPVASEPVFVDADGSGDAPTLTDLRLRAGRTTTEDWSIEYDGARWWAKGSRSGVQDREPVAGERYWTDRREVEFDLAGTATAGDRFEIRTDTGLVEYAFEGGEPTAVLADGTDVLVAVAGDDPSVQRYDGLSGAWLERVALPVGALPGRMALDGAGGLWVADTGSAAVHHLRFDLGDPVAVETLTTAAPVIDLAWAAGEDADGQPFAHLFVAPVGLQRVDVWSPEAGAWVDPNPVTPEVEGVPLGAPVTGLSASVGPVWLQEVNPWGARDRVPVVGVATALGDVFLLEGPSGCAVKTGIGPAVPDAYTSDDLDVTDLGTPSSTAMVADAVTGAYVVASSCGGVTRDESWTVRYDSATLSWVVEGSLSGVQAARAYEDVRYVSDTGAISFFLASGAYPPTDGDSFAFTTGDGLVAMRASFLTDTDSYSWFLSGRPAAFETENGRSGGGWDEVDRRQYLLLPVTQSDLAARLWLDTGETSVAWR